MSQSCWIEKVEVASGTRWKARWYEGRNQRSRTFHHKREAEAFRREKVWPALAAGKPVDGFRIAFGEYLAEYEDWYQGRSVAPATKQWLHYQLKAVGNPWRRMALEDLTPRRLEELMAERAAGTEKQSTVTAFRKALSMALGKAVSWGYLDNNPLQAAETPKVARKAAAVVAVEDLDDPDEEVVTPADIPSHAVVVKTLELLAEVHTDYALMAASGAGAGLRFGEAAGLAPVDLLFDDGSIQVRRTLSDVQKQFSVTGNRHELAGTKTDAGKRVVDADPELMEKLKAHAEGREPKELLFRAPEGGLINRSNWGRTWRTVRGKVEDWCREVGETMPRDYTHHSFRHYYISNLVSSGVPLPEVARQAGHGDPGITLRRYSHFIPEDRDKVKAAVLGLV